MVKSIRHTDLASEEPGARADVGLPLDEVSLEAEVPLARFRFSSRAGPRSTLQSAMETISVAAAGCISVGTMSAIGAPKWVAISALPLLLGFHLCIRYLSRRTQCESCHRGGSRS
jgi:hypothetical protein